MYLLIRKKFIIQFYHMKKRKTIYEFTQDWVHSGSFEIIYYSHNRTARIPKVINMGSRAEGCADAFTKWKLGSGTLQRLIKEGVVVKVGEVVSNVD